MLPWYDLLMFTLSGFFIGLTMVGLGVLGVKYSFWIHQQTGAISSLERYTGSGSTYGIYKIVSTLLIIVGILWASGFGHNVMSFLFAPIAGLFHPPAQ